MLRLLFEEERTISDYPCDERLFARFEMAPSKGRFVNQVLTPHAAARGWSLHPVPVDPLVAG